MNPQFLVLIFISSVFCSTILLPRLLKSMKLYEFAAFTQSQLKYLSPFQQKVWVKQYDSEIKKLELKKIQLKMKRKIVEEELDKIGEDQ